MPPLPPTTGFPKRDPLALAPGVAPTVEPDAKTPNLLLLNTELEAEELALFPPNREPWTDVEAPNWPGVEGDAPPNDCGFPKRFGAADPVDWAAMPNPGVVGLGKEKSEILDYTPGNNMWTVKILISLILEIEIKKQIKWL